MKSILQSGLIALAFGLVGVANADAPQRKPAVSTAAIGFSTLDANTDGSVSTAEVQFVDDLRADFATLDVNRDEKLSPGEFAKWSRAGKDR